MLVIVEVLEVGDVVEYEVSSNMKLVNRMLLVFMTISVIFMAVGYSAINAITFEVAGMALATPQEGIFITDAVYNTSTNADLTTSHISSFYGSSLSSYVNLTNDPSSSITYTISMYNSDATSKYFDAVTYMPMDDNSTYTNQNITYSLNGLEKYDEVPGKTPITFTITFYYLDNTNITETDLSSYLNFRFISAEDLVTITFNANGGTLGTTTMLGKKGDAIGTMPIPTKTNYSFEGWYTALSGGTLYNSETILGSESEITLYARYTANPIQINNVPTITMTQSEAKAYYGQVVNLVNGSSFNPNASDQRTWRVFYIDTENKYGDGKGTIYLKADESSSKLIRFSTTFDSTNIEGYTSKFTTLSSTRYYKINGNNVVDSSGNVINTKYLQLNPTYAAGRKNISSTIFYENEKAAAYLSDPSQFTAYADSRTNYAVGSPSIEMWFDAWNSLYGTNYRFYYQYNVGVDGTTGQQKLPGYQMKLNSAAWNQAAGVSESLNIATIDTTGMFATTNGVFTSSPAIVFGGASLVRISSAGFIGNATINMNYAYEPVVSLNQQAMVYTTSYTG